LFDRATGQPSGMLRGHSRTVDVVAFSPDGKRVASGGFDNTVRLWNLNMHAESRVIRGSTEGLEAVALSPDGKTVVSGGAKQDPVLRVYRADTGAPVRVIPAHRGTHIHAARFSPDGKFLASVGDDGGLSLWDATTWADKPLWNAECLPPGNYYIGAFGVAFSADGKYVAACTWDAGRVCIHEVATGKRVRGWQMPIDNNARVWTPATGYGVMHVAFSPDGKKLAGSVWNRDTGRDYAIVWDISGEKEKELFRLVVPDLSVGGVAFSPDGKELAAIVAQEGTVRFWDANTGKPLAKALRGHSNSVGKVAYTRDGRRLVTAGGDRTVRVWDAASGEELLTLHGHTNRLSDVSVSDDGQRIASGGSDQTIRIWDAPRK
jgi:WD40 repeat protein